MKTTLVGLAILVVSTVVGCGATVEVDPNEPRLLVTDNVRIACADFAGDAFIETSLIAYETDRLNGFTWTEVRLDLAFQCDVDEVCLRCGNAVIDQIYDRCCTAPPATTLTFDDVFAACNSGVLSGTRDEIESFIITVEANRDAGQTKVDAIISSQDFCNTFWGVLTDEAVACNVCGNKSIDFVHGP